MEQVDKHHILKIDVVQNSCFFLLPFKILEIQNSSVGWFVNIAELQWNYKASDVDKLQVGYNYSGHSKEIICYGALRTTQSWFSEIVCLDVVHNVNIILLTNSGNDLEYDIPLPSHHDITLEIVKK